MAAICAGIAGAAAWAAGAPKLQFAETVQDFGKAAEGESLAGRFAFRNAGNAVLKIGLPDPSCGCTGVSVKPDTLQPGEKGELAFTLDLTNQRGAVEKLITVPSNDPQQPEIKLTIKGQVKALFDLSPAMLFFPDVAPGDTVRKSVRVKRLDGQKLLIEKAETTRDFLTVTIEPEENSSGQAARLVIEAKATGKPEQFSDILTVQLQNSTKPAFLIPVAGQLVSSIKLEPEGLIWNLPDAVTTRKIIISSMRRDRALDVGNFETTFDDLLVKVDELEQGKKFAVTLKLSRPPKETMRGVLSFDTNFPEHPKIDVPIVIRGSLPQPK